MENEPSKDFEIIDAKNISSVKSNSQPESAGVSMIANIPPPSALPSFIVAQTPPELKATSTEAPTSKLSSSTMNFGITNTTKSFGTKLDALEISVESINKPTSSPSKGPVIIQPLPPSSSASAIQESFQSAELHLEGQTRPSPAGEENNQEAVLRGDEGWMGWIKGTVQSVGHKVAEKAKSSMDTMITTLDPQMKEFINSGGDVDIIVASDKEVKVNPVKEAFQKVFGKANVSGYQSTFNEVASQPVGFSSALKSAEGRINNLRSSGKIHPQQPIVSVEGFIVQFPEDYWVEMALLLLDDPWHDIILQTYTQPVPVPEKFILDLQVSTPEEYPLKDTGFAKTVGQVASEHLNVPHTQWQETLVGIPRRDFILTAAKVLAELYRTRLPSDVI